MSNKSKFTKTYKSQYVEKLKDPRWQKLRLRVFERDGWKCRICDSTSNTLHAHHTYYETDSDGPWDYPDETIITLCAECHESEHVCISDAKSQLFKEISLTGFLTSGDIFMLADIVMEIRKDICFQEGERYWERMIVSHIKEQISRKKTDGQN